MKGDAGNLLRQKLRKCLSRTVAKSNAVECPAGSWLGQPNQQGALHIQSASGLILGASQLLDDLGQRRNNLCSFDG